MLFCLAPSMCRAAPADSPWPQPQANGRVAAGPASARLDYSESDAYGLTRDGVLDRERGRLDGYFIAAQWQGTLGALPLFLAGQGTSLRGATAYAGYLQSGTVLTPYSALTKNRLAHVQAHAGWPLRLGERAQLVPFMGAARHRWARELAGYTEYYRQTDLHAGLLGRLSGPRLSAEASVALLVPLAVTTSIPAFNARLHPGRARGLRAGAELRYALAADWSAAMHLSITRQKLDSSLPEQGLQIPPSTNRLLAAGISLARHF